MTQFFLDAPVRHLSLVFPLVCQQLLDFGIASLAVGFTLVIRLALAIVPWTRGWVRRGFEFDSVVFSDVDL